jgi:LysM repeat protein
LAVALLAAVLPVSLAFAQTHQVRPGDTLSGIAASYGVTMQQLQHANGITNPDRIYAGQVLSISGASATGGSVTAAARSHTVAPGETLSSIARQYGVTLNAMVSENGLSNPDRIYVGQDLAVPGGTGGAAAATAPAPMMTSAEVEAYIRQSAAEHGLPPSLMLGLAWMESGFNQNLTSWTGAIGVMQIMPETAEWALDYLEPSAVNWRTDARHNIDLGMAIFAHMHWQAGWDVEMTLGFYYQGWYSIELYGMFGETREYIANVLALSGRF